MSVIRAIFANSYSDVAFCLPVCLGPVGQKNCTSINRCSVRKIFNTSPKVAICEIICCSSLRTLEETGKHISLGMIRVEKLFHIAMVFSLRNSFAFCCSSWVLVFSSFSQGFFVFLSFLGQFIREAGHH